MQASFVKIVYSQLSESICASQTRYRGGSEVVAELCPPSSGATGTSAASPSQHPGGHLKNTNTQSTHLVDNSLTDTNTHQSATMAHQAEHYALPLRVRRVVTLWFSLVCDRYLRCLAISRSPQTRSGRLMETRHPAGVLTRLWRQCSSLVYLASSDFSPSTRPLISVDQTSWRAWSPRTALHSLAFLLSVSLFFVSVLLGLGWWLLK